MMTRWNRTVIALLTALGAAGACSSSGGKNDGAALPDARDGAATDTTAASVTAEQACQQLNEAEAQLAARCQGGALDDWRTYQAGYESCATYARHIAEGLVEYRPAGLAACLQKYAAPCGEANPYPCRYEVLHGKVADGQHCEDTEVCGTISGCINVSGADCGDVCGRFALENEPCGFFCGSTAPCLDFPLCGTDLFCANGTCVKAKTLGQTCGGTDQATCVFPLFCDVNTPDATATGVCAPLASGATCRSDAGCFNNEFCLEGTCTPRRAAGSPCADVPDGGCAPWTMCDPGGSQLCVAAGRIGQPCGQIAGTNRYLNCLAGACDGTQCVALGAAGLSCAAAACVQGAFCDATTAICQRCEP